MPKKMRIALLAGGWSKEHAVSMMSGDAVFEALDKSKYIVERFDPLHDLKQLVGGADRFDLVFSVLHGRLGEDGCIQGLLRILGIPMVGTGVLGSALAMNKKVAKELYRSAGLKVARDVCLARGAVIRPDLVAEGVKLPAVVKPVEEGSSLGMSLCRGVEELGAGIEKAFAHGEEVMVEEYIAGREMTCCVLGGETLETLPLVEIVSRSENGFFDYEAKYTPGGAEELCPAPLPDEMAQRLAEAAKSAHRALRCRVWSRTDMIVRGEEIFVLETNTLPGMTRNSLFPLAARAAGLGLGDLLDRLVGLTLQSADARKRLAGEHGEDTGPTHAGSD